MAWEKRGKTGQYYYRSVRNNRRVIKEYLGKGPAAQQAAEQVLADKESRAAERRLIAEEINNTATANQLADELDAASSMLVEAVLYAAGYWRQNYGPWRKRRGIK